MTLAERLELIGALEIIGGALEELQKGCPKADIKEDIFILRDTFQRMKKQVRGKDDAENKSSSDRLSDLAGDNVRFLYARPQNSGKA